ncbi:MATE family efflux transporter [Anaeromassilibacillus senegalensis]|uniref:MATE family efflux transporter n=1 Tax=Anaeromassilibacillus senegalensis TaxID=1673717 RepID=UPI000682266C
MKQYDLTNGSVPKQLLKFAFPIFIANLLQSCYSMVDMVVVGQFVGKAGLAAVSNAAMIGFIIQSVCTGVTMGGTVLIAQYKGAHDAQGQRQAIGTLFSVSTIAAALVTLISLLSYRAVFQWMRVPAGAMQLAEEYMQVICWGTLFVFGYNAVCSIMRGLGDSQSPLLFVAIATGINIALDLLLVGPLRMGTRGAALATIVSQGASFVISLFYLKKRAVLSDFTAQDLWIRGPICRMLLKIGLPSAIQIAVLNLSYLLVTGMLNEYGVAVAAASGIGLKVNTFAAMPCWAVGQAVTTMAGQNMGACQTSRAAKTAKTGLWISLGASFITMLLVQAFVGPIIELFNSDPEVVQEGIQYLRICCSLNSLLYAAMYTFDSFATGVGDSLFAMCNALLHSVVMRLLLSWLLGSVLGYGFIGIYWGEMLSPILSFFAGLAYFAGGRWQRHNLLAE